MNNNTTLGVSDRVYQQECIPVGCVPPVLYHTEGRGVSLSWGSLSGGISVMEILPGQRSPLPPVNRMTDTRLRLRAVIILPTMNFGTNKPTFFKPPHYYCPSTKREGNVSSSVSLSVHGGPMWLLATMPLVTSPYRDHPPPLGHVKMCSTRSLYALPRSCSSLFTTYTRLSASGPLATWLQCLLMWSTFGNVTRYSNICIASLIECIWCNFSAGKMTIWERNSILIFRVVTLPSR